MPICAPTPAEGSVGVVLGSSVPVGSAGVSVPVGAKDGVSCGTGVPVSGATGTTSGATRTSAFTTRSCSPDEHPKEITAEKKKVNSLFSG